MYDFWLKILLVLVDFGSFFVEMVWYVCYWYDFVYCWLWVLIGEVIIDFKGKMVVIVMLLLV